MLAWKLDTPNAGGVARAMDAFAIAYAALKAGDTPRELGSCTPNWRSCRRVAAVDDAYSANAAVPGVLERELRAMLMWQDGKRAEALALLREAAKLEDAIPLEFGPPDVVKPTHELLGELLLESVSAADAQREFVKALSLAPGRSLSVLGLGRAALAAGDTAVARKAVADLKRTWHSADAELPQKGELIRLIVRGLASVGREAESAAESRVTGPPGSPWSGRRLRPEQQQEEHEYRQRA